MVASSMRLTTTNEIETTIEDARSASGPLVALVGGSIARARGFPNGTLELFWANGSRLEILDTWSEYESYEIRHGDTLLIV
jgi:hypothetical protein